MNHKWKISAGMVMIIQFAAMVFAAAFAAALGQRYLGISGPNFRTDTRISLIALGVVVFVCAIFPGRKMKLLIRSLVWSAYFLAIILGILSGPQFMASLIKGKLLLVNGAIFTICLIVFLITNTALKRLAQETDTPDNRGNP